MSVAENIREVEAKIAAAAEKSGRKAEDVLLLAVSKTKPVELIGEAVQAGCVSLGENKVQEIMEKYEPMMEYAPEGDRIHWHLIGHLQTNKVKYIIDKVDMIHSLDSEKLAYEIDRQCAKIGKTMNVLCEINCGREENKSGIMPENAEEFCLGLSKYKNIKLCGFMTMAPAASDFDDYRKYFSETVKLVLDIWHKKLHNIERPVISMGMSGSFEAAIAEGSTIVRIGRSLFAKE